MEEIKLIALSASQELAHKIQKCLGPNARIINTTVHHFADGEILVELQESVRGQNVYVIQSTANPVTENLMELLICVDALKRSSAKEITAVIPYFGYARQDRKAKPRQPITAKLVADLLQTAGVDRVVTTDLHAAQIAGYFDIPVDDMAALPLISNYFKKLNVEDVTVVSPDHGGANRARKLANALDAPLAIIDKRRPKPNVAEITGIIGDVEGQNCIMIDDMIDTAGTIVAGAEALKEKGAKDVYIACTHPVFSGPAVQRLKDCVAKEIIVTDTIELPEEKMFDKLQVVSLDELLALSIYNIEHAQPISDVFDKFDYEV